jgi:hypothetical protein
MHTLKLWSSERCDKESRFSRQEKKKAFSEKSADKTPPRRVQKKAHRVSMSGCQRASASTSGVLKVLHDAVEGRFVDEAMRELNVESSHRCADADGDLEQALA